MEIISFIQDDEPDFHRPVFISKKHKAKTVSAEFMPFETKLRSFSAAKVYQGFSVKQIFIAVGRGLTSFGSFCKNNFRRILISLACALLTVVIAFFGAKLLRYKMSHTGPLNLETEESLDIENLNQLMSSFALETGAEVDSEGNLLGVETANVNTAKLFTQPVTYQNYKVRAGDTISGIALKFGLSNISTLISVNDIGNVRQLAAGQKLKIPSMDGIVYTVQKGDSINSIVTKYGLSTAELLDVNDLNSDVLAAGQVLFLPGASMDSKSLKNALGDMFKMPIKDSFRWTSMFGPRTDPISGKKSSHTGVDMACPTGTPIYAAMSGKVSYTGVSNIFGNYVIINHENGYQTLYAHMSKIIAKKGQWVSQGTKIGLVGSTGYSTGPHLHFTVYKNGKLIDPKSVLK